MNYLLKITLLIAIITGLILAWKHAKKSSKHIGTIIILNGPSAAGKTSIQTEFQHLMMPQLWIKVGIDNLFDKPMPDINLDNLTFWQKENQIRWVTTSTDQSSNTIITLFTGPQGDNVAYGMNSAIAAYAENGCNVIVDYIAYKKEWLDDLRKKVKHLNVYWVKVSIPLHTLEEREIARNTSPKGHARSHYDRVYWNIEYDMEVHSDQNSASAIAQKIKTTLNI